MPSGVEYFYETPCTKAEILTMNKNVLRKNIYVQTKAILKNQCDLIRANFKCLFRIFYTQWLHNKE